MADTSRLDWELWPNDKEELREFRWGKVYQLRFSGRPCIMVVVRGNFYGTLYEYSDMAEFKTERNKVLNFGDDGAAAGVPAPHRPEPPSLTDALSIPAPATAT